MTEKIPLNRRSFVAAGALTLLTGCTGDSSSGEGGTAEPTSEATTQTESATTDSTQTFDESSDNEASTSQSVSVTLGEAVEGENLTMVARSVSTTDKLGEFQEAQSGNEFVVVRLAVKNISEKFIDFSSFWQTRLKDGENHVYDASFGVTTHPFDSGTLAPGEVSRGDVVYEVPKDVGELTMQFDFSAFDLFKFKRVTVNLSDEAESIANLSQKLNTKILSTGESASNGGVSVVVHGVRTESKLGEYTEAEDGREYVIPDVEITNGTEEPLTVSTMLQMRVKTGTGLSSTADLAGSSSLSRGYNEGSDIAPDESRRGELAFQVEEDASSLYFVFDFLDIADAYKVFWELR
ncbi:protein of unknown function [Halogranum rubrum]|uniref:DUF4352 domain-containing protein n=1 Tax=Halogranum rubrum TaxID=553466 RepID=A0A1I4EUW6_9EURY|nr:DUF4352 domain-containing protein [Halogranum rubrum]SFL07941.1 protein of unknown function [Halogranum rubrum]